MSITMHKPDTARARPSTLLEDDASYEKLYNTSNNINSYFICALIGKKSEYYLKTNTDLSVSDKNNLRFYLAFTTAVIVTKNKFPGFRSLENFSSQDITDDKIALAYNYVSNLYNSLGGGDKLAKGADFIKEIRFNLDKLIES